MQLLKREMDPQFSFYSTFFFDELMKKGYNGVRKHIIHLKKYDQTAPGWKGLRGNDRNILHNQYLMRRPQSWPKAVLAFPLKHLLRERYDRLLRNTAHLRPFLH